MGAILPSTFSQGKSSSFTGLDFAEEYEILGQQVENDIHFLLISNTMEG
jgi:hypothetical protein